MKTLLKVAFLLVITHGVFAQNVPDFRRNMKRHLAYWSPNATLDTITPLPTLISRLNNNWQFVETGKAYWIGYTADMCAVAAYGEAAITPLVNFIDNGSSEGGKIGALYCLHLIGIEGEIAGRTYEKFRNVNARQVLRKFLTSDAFQTTVIGLLIRDPWQSDVPYIFDALQAGSSDKWALVNSTLRYSIPGLPLHHGMPSKMDEVELNIPKLDRHLPITTAANQQTRKMLDAIKAMNLPNVTFENLAADYVIWGNRMPIFDKQSIRNGWQGLTAGSLLDALTEVDYLHIGSRIQYYVQDGKLVICSTETARKRLINWWNTQSQDFKQNFSKNAALTRQK